MRRGPAREKYIWLPQASSPDRQTILNPEVRDRE